MTQDRYFGRGVVKTGAAGVLEVFGTSEQVATKTGGKLGDGVRLP